MSLNTANMISKQFLHSPWFCKTSVVASPSDYCSQCLLNNRRRWLFPGITVGANSLSFFWNILDLNVTRSTSNYHEQKWDVFVHSNLCVGLFYFIISSNFICSYSYLSLLYALEISSEMLKVGHLVTVGCNEVWFQLHEIRYLLLGIYHLLKNAPIE